MSSPSSVILWVKAEPFNYGALQVAPHPRLSPHNVKKIVPYAKTKGKLGFPQLSYSVWKHIACNKLQLSEDLAWMYFEGYLLLSDMPSGQKVALYNQLAKCKTSADRDKWRAQLTVDTLKFVLLLYIQQLHKINLRTSMVLNEEWPSRSRSPELEGRSTPSSSKALDEHSHLTFVLNHLNELMELLIEPDAYGTAGSDVNLSMEAVEALSFIIAGSLDRSKAVTPIHELALTPQAVKAKSGFSKITGTFSFRMLQSWLRATLTTNPFGIGSCIATGRRLSWPMAAEDKESKGENLGKRGKIATNAHLVPREHIMGNKVIIMSQVCKQTISRSSGTLEMATVKVHRCHFAYLYLLSPIRSVSIEKCRNSTIILGAVDTVVHVNACEQVTVIGACRRFSVSNSTLCTFHLLTPTRPLILGGNDSLILAPYHTHYAKLEDHMATVGLPTVPNVWDQPFCVGPDHHEDHPVWELMPPADFYTFNIPFEMQGNTKAIPYEIPPKYKKAISQREKQIDLWQKTVKEAGLSKEQRKQFQQLVETHFQDWLVESGHKREVDGLAAPADAKKKGTP